MGAPLGVMLSAVAGAILAKFDVITLVAFGLILAGLWLYKSTLWPMLSGK
jgi:hypothetical protein